MHVGRLNNSVTESTNLLLVGDLRFEMTVEKAVSKGVRQVNYAMVQSIIHRKLSPAEALYTPNPGTAAVCQVLGPPAIQRDAEMPDTEETMAGKIRWSNLKSKKWKDPTETLDQSALVAGSKVIRPRGVLDLARLPKGKPPKHISVVCVTLKGPSGTVKDLAMDLLFMRLDIIWLED